MVQGPFSSSPVTRWTYDLLNAGFLQMGNKADRPLASTANRMMYLAEDTGEMLWSNGTDIGNDLGDGWGVAIAVDPATNVAGLRTLGLGAQQGAAGTHGHSTLITRTGISGIALSPSIAYSQTILGSFRGVTSGSGGLWIFHVNYDATKDTVITAPVLATASGNGAVNFMRRIDGSADVQLATQSVDDFTPIVFTDAPDLTADATLDYSIWASNSNVRAYLLQPSLLESETVNV